MENIMFKQLAALTNIMKNAGDIQQRMADVKERLSRQTVDGHSSCGRVTVTVNGKMDVTAVRFASEPSEIGSKNGVEALVLEAINNGLRKSKDLAATEMKTVADDLGLPPEMLEKFGALR